MNPAIKRMLTVILLILTATIIGFGLYLLFKKATTPSIPGGQVTPPVTGQLPGAGERTTTVEVPPISTPLGRGGEIVTPLTPQNVGFVPTPAVRQIISESVSYPSVNSNGNIRYYNNSDGKFYKLGSDGKLAALSTQTFYNVSKVTWAQNNDKAVLEYPDSSKTIYNFEKQKQTTLPKHWEDFSFSPDSGQVAAKSIGIAPENRWLVTVNDDGSGTTLVEPMGDNADKVIMDWSPSRQTVAFSQTGEPLGADRKEILFIGLHGENFKSAIVEGSGFEPQWSPTGQSLLYSVYSTRSDFKPELWITGAYGDNIGGNRQMLKLNTWAHKCTFTNESTLFCAVPKDLPQGAGILPEVASDSKDDMYKIDLRTGLKTAVNLGGDYNVTQLNYDKTKNKLYFTDQTQTGVFEIKI